MCNQNCRGWYEGDPIMEEYHDHEWCKINHDDRFEFEMLCLEGASVGLSWKTIMHKREAYRKAFHYFDIDSCAAMTDQELEKLLSDKGLIRNQSKILSVRKNAQVVKKIQAEFGSLDAYIWSFTDGKQIDGGWTVPEEIPTKSDISVKMSADMKKRGIAFVGPVITYSFLQAVGIVNDHLAGCEYRVADVGTVGNVVDAYIRKQNKTIQPRLNYIRNTIRIAIPEAEERISWSMPTYWKGRNIIHFAAAKKHIGIYPGPEAIAVFTDRLKDYKTSKGAVQFPNNRDLPLELVSEIARWCFKRNKK